MIANFMTSYLQTCGHEGGYVNDPLDRGGETYKGIARKFWPDWDGWAIIDAFKKSISAAENLNVLLNHNNGLQLAVESFYKEHYWDVNHCAQFAQPIADELFDTGVNQGAETAAKYFQRALNKLNRNQKDFSDLDDDGVIGFYTINAYEKYMATAKWSSRSEFLCQKWLLSLMNYYQVDKYIKIADKDLSQERFIPGWLNRV